MRAIITLAHNLRLKVVAEGVETEEQLAFLRLLRCDEGQGYLFGKPVPFDEIQTLMAPLNTRKQSVISARSSRVASTPEAKYLGGLNDGLKHPKPLLLPTVAQVPAR